MPNRRGRVAAEALPAVLVLGGCALAPWQPGTPASTAPSSTTTASPSAEPSTAFPTASPLPSPSATVGPSASASTPAPTQTATTTTTRPPTTTTCSIPSGLLGRDIESLGTTTKKVALTFDAGASNAAVGRILSTLASTGTPASFFLTGKFAQTHPTTARSIAAAHPIGTHSLTHPEFTTLTDAQIVSQLTQARTAIVNATGQDPRPWFRFPYGDRDARTIRVVNGQCNVPFRWTVDSLGWKGTSGGMPRDAVVDRVLNNIRPGGIVLMHVGSNPDDGTTLDADAPPAIISGLRAQGYTFTTLDYVLSRKP